jgi:hypothetical protein
MNALIIFFVSTNVICWINYFLREPIAMQKQYQHYLLAMEMMEMPQIMFQDNKGDNIVSQRLISRLQASNLQNKSLSIS